MFLKSFRIKANTQMKSTERKNFKALLGKHFPCLTEADIHALVPNKEVIASIKAVTHNESTVVIYTVKKLPVVFEYEKQIFPTVYLLWQHPDLICSFTTHPPVFSKLVNGADLMLPGVVLPERKQGPGKYGRLARGDCVSVNLSNNRAPVAVGTAALSSMDMFMAAGRGKCVNVLHVFGDKLWSIEDTITQSPPELGPPTFLLQTVVSTSETENVATDNDDPIADERRDDVVNPIDSVERMDDLLKYCFLKTLKYSRKEFTLPVLTSNFYRMHMFKSCPCTKSLDIKKSSYKKLNKFLNKMSEDGFVKISEMQKGVDSIVSVNTEQPDLLAFVADPNDKKSDQAPSENKEVTPNIVEACTVTNAVAPLFAEIGLRKGESVQLQDVRKHFTNYVRKHNLKDEKNNKYIVPNELLKNILKTSDPILWDEAMEKIINSMGSCYKVTYTDNSVMGKGKLMPITMAVGTRSCNKKVTIVDNVELYGIRMSDFAKECQHGVAASTTISLPPGKTSQQLQIQGNQVKFVFKLLTEKYKINKKYIRGLEFAVKTRK